MLTNFFGKSKPINFLIVSLYLIIGYGIWVAKGGSLKVDFQIITTHILLAFLCVFIMLLLDFIIRKNSLTYTNTYAILLFSCFVMMFPIIFSEKSILISNVFLLLAFRRILSLSSEKNMEKKILDASIWITLASLFYFWSLIFIIVLFIVIIKTSSKKHKHILIPFIGFSAIFIVTTVYHIILKDSFLWFNNIDTTIGLDFSAYHSFSLLIPSSMVLAFVIWTGMQRISKVSSVAKKNKLNYLTVLLIVLISVLTALLSPQKTGAEVFFILAPLSIIVTNYIEIKQEIWFKELLLWSILLLPFFIYFV